jgi:hypothetical protein
MAKLAAPDENASFAEELARRRRRFGSLISAEHSAWLAGDALAVVRAANICKICHEPPPRWLVDAILTSVVHRMSKAARRDYEAFQIHCLRWAKVKEVHERGAPWDDSYPTASDELAGTEAKAGEYMMKESYSLVQKAGGKAATFKSYRHVVAERRRQRATRRRKQQRSLG